MHLPCVTVGLALTGGASPPMLDVLLSAECNPRSPFVGCGGRLDSALKRLRTAVAACPLAAVSLVQLLRLGDRLDLEGALLAESLTYAMLQSGPEHQRWLAARTPVRPRPAEAPVVLTERRGNKLHVTLNRPRVRNAVNIAVRDALAEGLALASADPSITEVHLAGVGSAFCSGGDLSEFGTKPDPVTGHVVRTTRSVAAGLADCADRLLVHVQGACVGAGVEMAAFAARVIAAPDAVFALPELGFGLIPGAGGTASLPRRIGRQRTAFMALTGDVIDAATALEWGLVDEIA
jgi:hypothetical protein